MSVAVPIVGALVAALGTTAFVKPEVLAAERAALSAKLAILNWYETPLVSPVTRQDCSTPVVPAAARFTEHVPPVGVDVATKYLFVPSEVKCTVADPGPETVTTFVVTSGVAFVAPALTVLIPVGLETTVKV